MTDRPALDAGEAGDAHVLGGPWRAAIADEQLRRSYPDADFDDTSWESVTLPHHWRSEPAFAATDGPLLYRTQLDTPAPFGPGAERDGEADEPRRTWLTLDGVFYTSDVWLDGSYLGDTEGYFFPHTFEISDALRAQHEHTLALEVSCRPEADRAAKRNLTGVFQHSFERDQHGNPGGIWRPVRIEQTGPVRVKHFRTSCRDANVESATVFVRAVLDTVVARTVTIDTTIAPVGAGAGVIAHRSSHPLATGENRLEWVVEVPDPQLWWPHTLGAQPRYDVRVEVKTGTADPGREAAGPDEALVVSDRRHRRIGLRSVTMRDWIFSINGERLFLKGANQGPTKLALAEASDDDFARDVALAKAANLDFLRVRAHVSKPGFYDAADEAGLLLWQDMPLQWGYHRSIRKQARRQARELVDLLAHHPSVFVWCGHNEPLAIDIGPDTLAEPRDRAKLVARGLVGQALPAWNKSVLDTSIKRVLEKHDGSRPVIAHSGVLPHLPQLDGTDSHLWFGWHHGDARGLSTALRLWPRLARFVSELGAQAVPTDAAFLQPDRWPDLDWEAAAERHGLQRAAFERQVPPAEHATFDGWRDASQRHQADLLRTQVEALRLLKYAPTGGFAISAFADGHPLVSVAVLDHQRVPKLGYDALAAACRPIAVIADRLPPAVRPGDALALAVYVVNDARISLSDMIVRAHLCWGEGTGSPTDRSPDRSHVWRWQGDVPPDSCTRIGTIEALVPDQRGPLTLDVSLDRASAAPDPVGLPAAAVLPIVSHDRSTIVTGEPPGR